MTAYGNITVNVRTAHGKGAARELRRQGKVPAVLYGKGQGNLSIAFDPLELHKATDPSRDINTLFHLTIKEDGKPDVVEPAVIVEVQRDQIRDDFVHVDFMRVDLQQEVERKIPVRYTGRALGVMAGGRLKTFRRSVRVAAKPVDFPVALDVDVTPLEIGQYLRLKDITLPGARILDRPEAPVALVEAAKAKEEAAPGAAPAAGAAAPAPAAEEKKKK